MKQMLVILSALLLSNLAFAADDVQPQQQQYQPVCVQEAQNAAHVLFLLNQKLDQDAQVQLAGAQILDANPAAEGGYEVYEFIFSVNNLQSTPYRVTTLLNGCQVVSFETPFN